jgi:hypothetical protein
MSKVCFGFEYSGVYQVNNFVIAFGIECLKKTPHCEGFDKMPSTQSVQSWARINSSRAYNSPLRPFLNQAFLKKISYQSVDTDGPIVSIAAFAKIGSEGVIVPVSSSIEITTLMYELTAVLISGIAVEL